MFCGVQGLCRSGLRGLSGELFSRLRQSAARTTAQHHNLKLTKIESRPALSPDDIASRMAERDRLAAGDARAPMRSAGWMIRHLA